MHVWLVKILSLLVKLDEIYTSVKLLYFHYSEWKDDSQGGCFAVTSDWLTDTHAHRPIA